MGGEGSGPGFAVMYAAPKRPPCPPTSRGGEDAELFTGTHGMCIAPREWNACMAVRPCACEADMMLFGVALRSTKSEVGSRGVEMDGGADMDGDADDEAEAATSTSIGVDSFTFCSVEGEALLALAWAWTWA